MQSVEQALVTLETPLERSRVQRRWQLGNGGIQLGREEETPVSQPGWIQRSTSSTAASAVGLSL